MNKNKDNIIIYVSSRNNYDMLEGEVLKNIDTEGFEFINVDDKSCNAEITKGKAMCKKHNIVFLENKSRGVQMATQTLIDFINKNRPNCKYVLCFQHDNHPITPNFFNRLSEVIERGDIDDFGAIGFNVIDNGKYTGRSYQLFKDGKFPIGMLGLCHLSIGDNKMRWISPFHNIKLAQRYSTIEHPFSIEFPMWAAIGINVNLWNELIEPTTDYQFHLWFPDIAMQFNKANKPLVVFPRLYCINEQEIKNNYGIPNNSAQSAKQGNAYHFGEYGPHLTNFKKRWNWDYENTTTTFQDKQYEGTLLSEYFNHDPFTGPLRKYEIKY